MARPVRRPGRRRNPLASLLLLGVATATVRSFGDWRCRSVHGVQPRSLPPAAVGAATLEASIDVPIEAASTADSAGAPFKVLHEATLARVRPLIARWEKMATEGRVIRGFGRRATELVESTLKKVDAEATTSGLPAERFEKERKVIEVQLQQELHAIFLVQRSTVEQMLYQRLRKDLLRKMRWKKRELDVKEKLRLLHVGLKDYDMQARDLQPAFVADSEHSRAEKRLSELQWGIGDTPEAKEMKLRWKMERMRRMPTRQGKGISVSFSPGLRLMLRPQGLGNLQISSRRKVGPPHNPNEVSIGVLNDGRISDVYNKQAHPPMVKFQPTVGVEMRIV